MMIALDECVLLWLLPWVTGIGDWQSEWLLGSLLL